MNDISQSEPVAETGGDERDLDEQQRLQAGSGDHDERTADEHAVAEELQPGALERVPVDARGRRKDDADELIPPDQRIVPSVPRIRTARAARNDTKRYASAGSIFSTLKASMTSPTLMSLYVSKPIPHSNPSRTSFTSSLKRFNDPRVPV